MLIPIILNTEPKIMIFKSENLGTKPRRDILSYSFTSFLLFVCRSRKKMRILHSSCAQSDYKVKSHMPLIY